VSELSCVVEVSFHFTLPRVLPWEMFHSTVSPCSPSSITGFFLYSGTDPFSEINIEVYNDGTGNVDFVTYVDGQRTNYVSKDFRFDPSADFHNYRIDYNPGSVPHRRDPRADVDGVPSTSMKLLVNPWFPDWIRPDPGQAPDTGRATRIDWIVYDRR
jgi:endo-1,3-1,4-beta-glycanase ExoK